MYLAHKGFYVAFQQVLVFLFFLVMDFMGDGWLKWSLILSSIFLSLIFIGIWYKMSNSDSVEEKRRLLGLMLNISYALPIIGSWFFVKTPSLTAELDKSIEDAKWWNAKNKAMSASSPEEFVLCFEKMFLINHYACGHISLVINMLLLMKKKAELSLEFMLEDSEELKLSPVPLKLSFYKEEEIHKMTDKILNQNGFIIYLGDLISSLMNPEVENSKEVRKLVISNLPNSYGLMTLKSRLLHGTQESRSLRGTQPFGKF